MNHLIGYLTVGVLVTLAIFVWHRMSGASLFERKSELLDAIYPERKTLRYRVLTGVVAPILTGVAMIAAWPVAIYMQGKMVRDPRVRAPADRVFAVNKKDLLQQLTPQEIEARERITDPLGAVPDLPFGHLNAAWGRFTAQLRPGDSIWSFAAQWDVGHGQPEELKGYVAWRKSKDRPYFLTSR